MKHKENIIAFFVAFILSVLNYLWNIFFKWGMEIFNNQFSFSRMVLPYIILFLFVWGVLYIIMILAGEMKRENKVSKKQKELQPERKSEDNT